MPSIPKYTKCLHLGCSNNRSKYNNYCIEHGGRDTYNHKRYNSKQERQDFNAMYATKQWRTFRQIQLSKQPLCAGCLADGRIVAAEHIDHVFPWSAINEQAFYHNIFQSLCASCHSSKTSLEHKGIYRRYGKPNKDYKLSDYLLALMDDRDAFSPKNLET